MWEMIMNFIRDPKNIGLTLLGAAVVFLCVFSTGQYIALGVKDVRMAKIGQELKTKDATIAALTTENRQLSLSIAQTKKQLEKEKKLHAQAVKIQSSIKEGMNDEQVVETHNDIVDLFNSGL